MTTRKLLETVLEGGLPERTPISFCSWMLDDPQSEHWPRNWEVCIPTMLDALEACS